MKDLKLNELVFSVVASNFSPSLLQPNALKISGLVPQDWALAQDPIVNANGSQVVYQNGVQVAAQQGRCLFAETLQQQLASELESPALVKRFVGSLPNLDYQAVGINLRGYVAFTSESYSPQDYIEEHLLSSGDWLQNNSNSRHSEIKQLYVFDDRRLSLTINSATLNLPENKSMPILLFGGTFEYQLENSASLSKADQVNKIIDSGAQDLQTFRDVVSKFPSIESKEPALAS